MSLADHESPEPDRDGVARFELLDRSDLEVLADFDRQSTRLGDPLRADPDNLELGVRRLRAFQ